MATRGDLYLANTGDFFMATGRRRAASRSRRHLVAHGSGLAVVRVVVRTIGYRRLREVS
jgi:hypothetical protein